MSLSVIQREGLVPVNWEQIEDLRIDLIWIQSQPLSPVYGPYRVTDALTYSICKLDGTKPSSYPRDTGLFARRLALKKTDVPKKSSSPKQSHKQEYLNNLIERVLAKIEHTERELAMLKSEYELLNEMEIYLNAKGKGLL